MAQWYPFGLFAIAAVAVSFLGSWIVVSSFGGTEGIVPAVIAAVPALVSAVAAVMAAVAALRAARREDGAKDVPHLPAVPDARMAEPAEPVETVVRVTRHWVEEGQRAELASKLVMHEGLRLAELMKRLSELGEIAYDGENGDWLLTLTRNVTATIDAVSLTPIRERPRGRWA